MVSLILVGDRTTPDFSRPDIPVDGLLMGDKNLNPVDADYRWDLLRADTVTIANRIYTREALETAADVIRTQQRHMVVLGAPQFTDAASVALERVCAKMVDPQIEGDVLTVKVELLDTPMGKILANLLKSQVPMGLFSSGSGMAHTNESKEVVISDYSFSQGFFEAIANTDHNNIADDLDLT